MVSLTYAGAFSGKRVSKICGARRASTNFSGPRRPKAPPMSGISDWGRPILDKARAAENPPLSDNSRTAPSGSSGRNPRLTGARRRCNLATPWHEAQWTDGSFQLGSTMPILRAARAPYRLFRSTTISGCGHGIAWPDLGWSRPAKSFLPESPRKAGVMFAFQARRNSPKSAGRPATGCKHDKAALRCLGLIQRFSGGVVSSFNIWDAIASRHGPSRLAETNLCSGPREPTCPRHEGVKHHPAGSGPLHLTWGPLLFQIARNLRFHHSNWACANAKNAFSE